MSVDYVLDSEHTKQFVILAGYFLGMLFAILSNLNITS